MIPKQIFKIWISDKPVPEKFDKYTRTWKEANPDFEIIDVGTTLWADSPFLKWAMERKAYTLINHYMRCYVLYEYGGVYLDLDVECVKDLTPLLSNEFTIGIEDGHSVNNAVIISEKGHPFLRMCMAYMDNFEFKKEDVELATGPHLFTKLAKHYYGRKNNEIGVFTDGAKESKITITAPEYFYPYHYSEVYSEKFITDKTYCIHHWNQTWNDLVSIIIPCYKQAQFLSDAIESALQQTYKNIEVIVVNDGSPDNTSGVAKRYPQVKLIEQKNAGLSAARNTGIKASKGKWIVLLDSDDKLHHNFIMRTINQGDIVSTYLQTFGLRKDIWKPKIQNPKFADLIKNNCIHYCSIFKREVWEKTGGFDESMLIGYEDWEFWTHAARLGFKIHVQPEILVYYRKHGRSMVDEAMAKDKELRAYILKKHGSFKVAQ